MAQRHKITLPRAARGTTRRYDTSTRRSRTVKGNQALRVRYRWVGMRGCEVRLCMRLCDPCARVSPCVLCVRSHTDTHSNSHTHIHTMAGRRRCPGDRNLCSVIVIVNKLLHRVRGINRTSAKGAMRFHKTCAMKRAFAGLATPIGGVDACAVVFVA